MNLKFFRRSSHAPGHAARPNRVRRAAVTIALVLGVGVGSVFAAASANFTAHSEPHATIAAGRMTSPDATATLASRLNDKALYPGYCADGTIRVTNHNVVPVSIRSITVESLTAADPRFLDFLSTHQLDASSAVGVVVPAGGTKTLVVKKAVCETDGDDARQGAQATLVFFIAYDQVSGSDVTATTP